MRRHLERLEDRNLLAGDVQLVVDTYSAPNDQGEVTAQIRVFADADGEVLVQSSLTDELESVTWELKQGHSNQTMDLDFLPSTPDFRIEGGLTADQRIGGPRLLQNIGDLNGDGNDDFLQDQYDRAIVVFGGINDGITAPGSNNSLDLLKDFGEDGNDNFTFSRSFELGDINGDGFDEIIVDIGFDSNGQINNRIVWGAAEFPDSISLQQAPDFQSADGIGDVNGDGIDDFFVRAQTFNSRTGYVLFGANGLESEGIVPSQMVSEGRGIEVIASARSKFIESAGAIGDLNNDGFDDFMIGTDPYLIYGGPTLLEEGIIDIHNLKPTAGFYLGHGGVSVIRTPATARAEVGGIGDVNGDGLDDVLISYDGGECLQCTATDKDNLDTVGGGLILYGGTTVGSSGTFDPTTDPHTLLEISTSFFNGGPKAELHDVNGDGLFDVHLSADGQSHIVVTGRDGFIPSQNLGHVFDCCDGSLDGDSTFAFQLPPSVFWPPTEVEIHNFQYLDVNSDGIADALTSKFSEPGVNVFSGSEDALPRQGEGDIREVIRLEPHTSAIFTVRGIRKKNAEQATTIAVPVDGIDVDLTNNISSKRSAVSLSVELEVSDGTPIGKPIEATLRISNAGPSDAISARVTDELFGLSDVSWTRSEHPFTEELDLRETRGIFAASIPAPERVRYSQFIGNFLNDEILYTSLGSSLRATDFNGDGFDDLIVRVEGSQAPGQCFIGCTKESHDLVFAGSATFGAAGEFPTPLSGPTTGREINDFGDFNGDGWFDRVLTSTDDPSRVRVLFATADNPLPNAADPDGHNGFSITLDTSDVSSFTMGDLNGDGFDDLVVSDQSRSGESSQSRRMVHVVYGSAEPISDGVFDLNDIDGRNGFRMTLQGTWTEASPGTEVRSNFDVNGDGVDDLLIGDPSAGARIGHNGNSSPGAVYVVLGRTMTTVSGTGTIDETVDVRAGSTLEYVVRGISTASLSGSYKVEAAANQIDLFPDTNVALVVNKLVADFNNDGNVDFEDFLILSANFGKEVSSTAEGDINQDGLVDFTDFLVLSDEFGEA